MLSPTDISEIQSLNIPLDQVQSQINRFADGFRQPELSAPATVGDGIMSLSPQEVKDLVKRYEESDKSVLKFVPASGAATRMFKSLFAFLEDNRETDEITTFFNRLKKFAFYGDLTDAFEKQYGKSLDQAISEKNYQAILQCLLLDEGLAYGKLPKGLLRFHRYEDHARTPLEEHIEEGIQYASKNNSVNIHFTVSLAHHDLFRKHAEEAISSTEGYEISISYSYQEPATNTIAVDLENRPFRSSDGSLLFRPAGHGALLDNLNRLDADVIFIKNIDNILPDRMKPDTVKYKKVLAGILLKFQEETFSLLKRHDEGEHIGPEAIALLSNMGCKGDLTEELAIENLNRPVRVCGMVRNEGEPGGGPFWVKEGETSSLQIVESAQIDMNDEHQVKVLKSSTYFNPVDLVCGIKNYRGEQFNLFEYRDDNMGIITEKSYQGKTLKAMELPGLWNGSMANWNTIFVEVPLSTFNPVKTIMDLLKEAHQ